MRTSAVVLLSASLLGAFGCSGAKSERPAATSPTPTPAAPECAFTLTVPEIAFNASGGTALATVTTAPNCRWSVNAGNTSWITVESRVVAGPGTVPLTADPNRSFSSRASVIQLLDDSASVAVSQTVLQRGAGCLYSVQPETVTVASPGAFDGRAPGPVKVHVHTDPSDCSWRVRVTVPWMLLLESRIAGTGDDEIFLTVLENFTAAPRVGELVVAGLSGLNPDAQLTVSQTGR